MSVLLLAEHGSKGWWFEFVETWGNTASVAGVVIALVAFPVTWRIQARIRHASLEAVRKVALLVLTGALENLHRQLMIVREAGRQGVWIRAFDSCFAARLDALKLIGNPHLTRPENDSLRAHADNLTQVTQYIEQNKLSPDPSPSFRQDKRAIIDSMISFLVSIQARIGSRTWGGLE